MMGKTSQTITNLKRKSWSSAARTKQSSQRTREKSTYLFMVHHQNLHYSSTFNLFQVSQWLKQSKRIITTNFFFPGTIVLVQISQNTVANASSKDQPTSQICILLSLAPLFLKKKKKIFSKGFVRFKGQMQPINLMLSFSFILISLDYLFYRKKSYQPVIYFKANLPLLALKLY